MIVSYVNIYFVTMDKTLISSRYPPRTGSLLISDRIVKFSDGSY